MRNKVIITGFRFDSNFNALIVIRVYHRIVKYVLIVKNYYQYTNNNIS